MKSYRNLIEDYQEKKWIGSWTNDDIGEYSATALIIAIIVFIGVIVFYLNSDPLKLRPINQIYCYNNSIEQEIKLVDIIKTEKKKRLIDYDYSEQIRKEDIDVLVNVKIKEINHTDSWQIVSKTIYSGSPDKSLSIWLLDIPNIENYQEGDRILVQGKLNGINSDWIIISNAEVVTE